MITFLQNDYSERCNKNPQYSLRAYSRSLSIPVSTLSEILNQKRPLTKKLRNKIGLALNLAPEEIASFHAKDHGNKDSLFEDADSVNYQELALDSFHVISDWYHYGILQLMKTKDFKEDLSWISKRLGIKPLQVKLALSRLERLGIIDRDKNGAMFDATQGATSHLKNNFTSDELKSFQVKALEKAIESLKSVPVNKRDNTSMTLAMSKAAIPFAKEEIKKFRRSLTKKLEGYGPADEVYQMAISLTPLTIVNDN